MSPDGMREAATLEQRWVLALTSAAAFMVVLDALVVSTALTAIRVDLGASVEQLGWMVNAYTLAFAVLLMPAAAAADWLGRKRVFTAGIGVFTAASAACALSPGIGWLIAARAVQGSGAALVMPCALTLIGAAFPPPLRPKALGMFAAVTGLAVPLGPLMGGAVVQGISWQWIFWINVPAGVVTIVLARTRLPESHGPGGGADLPGLVLVAGAALAVVWGLVRGNTVGWGSAEVVSALAAGALLTLGFVGRELGVSEPMLPMRLFRSRAFSAGNTGMFFLWASALGSVFFMAQYLQNALHYGPLAAGLRLMPWGATTVLIPRLAGSLITRLGERPFLAAGMTLHAAGMTWIALIAGPHLGYWHLAAPLVISGAGVAMASPAAQSAVLSSVAPPDIGKASGAFSTMRQLGGAFGVAACVAVFGHAGSYASAQAFADGFAPAIGACAALALAGAIAGVALPGRRSGASRPPAHAAPPVQAGAWPVDLNQPHAQENRTSHNAFVTEQP
jgi:EmrB/QacA subfamily drug resistance transporter